MAVDAAPIDLQARLLDFPIQTRATLPFRVVRGAVRIALRALFSIEVEGLENLPRGNAVIVANHLGWADVVVLLCRLPARPRLHVIGEILGLSERTKSFVRSVGGVIPVDRARHGDGALLEHVDACLRQGASLLLFPEGRTGEREGEVLAFHKGFAHFATGAGVPVVPVGISGLREVLPAGATLPHPGHCAVCVGEPLSATRSDTAETFTARIESRVRTLRDAAATALEA